MASAALLNNFDQRAQDVLGKLRDLPPSTWRTLVIVIALIWVCHSLARLIWIVLPAPELPAPEEIAVVSAAEEAKQVVSVDLEVLQTAQIFGKFVEGAQPQEEVAPPEQNVDVDVETTKLNLKLVGLVASTLQSESSAVIAKGSDQKIYQIDDKMPVGKNVTLAKVLHDRAILNNNGNFEALWLYTEADFKVNYARSSPEPDPEPASEPRGEIQAKIKPSQIPKNLSEVVRFSVHREEGQMVGFRIRPGKNRELFDQMGLKANDVVTSVNGIAIDSPQAIRDNYQQLKTATSADLEIRRGEETLYVNVSIDSN